MGYTDMIKILGKVRKATDERNPEDVSSVLDEWRMAFGLLDSIDGTDSHLLVMKEVLDLQQRGYDEDAKTLLKTYLDTVDGLAQLIAEKQRAEREVVGHLEADIKMCIYQNKSKSDGLLCPCDECMGRIAVTALMNVEKCIIQEAMANRVMKGDSDQLEGIRRIVIKGEGNDR